MSQWDPTYGAPGRGFREEPSDSRYAYYDGHSDHRPSYPASENRGAGQAPQWHNGNDRPAKGPAHQWYNGNDRPSRSSDASLQSYIDVSNSNLQPTAVEFRPGTSYTQNGAVKRNGRQNKTKVYNSKHENSWYKGDKPQGSKKEQEKPVKETADVFSKMSVGSVDQEAPNGQGSRKTYDRGEKKRFGGKNDGDRRKPASRGNDYYGNEKGEWYSKRWSSSKKSENWRQPRGAGGGDEGKSVKSSKDEERSDRFKCKPQELKQKLDAGSQRERLEQMVSLRMLECLVCCERLRHTDRVWTCKQCHHILHLNCIVRWAVSSKLEEGWRCPACQNVYHEIPKEYRCYCDKVVDPKLEPGTLPHSCGDSCGRKGRSCTHVCSLLCHPGPCPDCTVMVARPCGCGATRPTVKCSSEIQVTCQGVCGKMLNCGVHRCEGKCHVEACADCECTIPQECFCGKESRTVPCTEDAQGVLHYECGDVCGKMLSCGNHVCKEACHPGPCNGCPSDPSNVGTCPCGQTKLKEERKSCLDPIPCCDKVCNQKLMCGQPSQPHLCKEPCHDGSCPPCPLSTLVKCRCGHMDKELDCKDLTSKADDARCQKKCTKKRLCCKHKCNQMCCIELDHECPLPCNHLLSCGLHRCEESCHRGRCPPCWRTSFQELYCECGASVLYPPVPCGTRPPPCNKPCSRIRPCNHEPHHNCHPGPCPPCTIFTTRLCHGQHETRQTIPCYQEDFSCGMPCNKEMSCGQHKCIQTCHKGDCPVPCNQPCPLPRASCEHSCAQPCHEPPCPTAPCKQSVTVTCQCGLRSSTRVCVDLASEYQKIAMSQLASKMADIQRGQSVDITDIVNKRGSSHKMLECSDECRLIERNRRLAIGLQIRNPDLSAKLTPRYSEYMRNWAKRDARFCQNVHDKLTELVQLAKQSKQKSRSQSFDCMNREKRHFVHEYCEHFGCESAAYDREPNRNIVATAFRDKSWLPSVSLIELLQRESGQRKVPGPVITKSDSSKMVPLKSGESVSMKLQSRTLPRPVTPPAEFVDYFDNPP